MADPDQFENEEFETSAAPRARTSSIATMGQLLLQGYAMLADSCETCGVPLMRKPNSQEIICVNCDSTGGNTTQPAPPTPAPALLPNGIIANGHLTENEEDIEAAPQPLRERITQQSTLQSTTRNTILKKTLDSSEAIADKMLEGWALLAEHCPLCSTPFVRSRDGRIYCVTCDLYAVREGSESMTSGGGAVAAAPQQQSSAATAAAPVERIIASKAPRSRIHTTNYVLPGNLEENAAVLQQIATAQSFVAAHLAKTAALLGKASSTEAIKVLEEIQACVEALNGMKSLLS